MSVYFFSRHKIDPKMVEDLGGGAINQVRGTIKDIRRTGDTITFSEIILAQDTDSVQEIVCHTISADSIVVAVAPLNLQIDWLNAGIRTFLIPQTTREVVDGEPIFSYTGLARIKRIIIDKEQWVGVSPTIEQKHAERSALHNS